MIMVMKAVLCYALTVAVMVCCWNACGREKKSIFISLGVFLSAVLSIVLAGKKAEFYYQWLLLGELLPLLACAAYTDTKDGVIPNLLPLAATGIRILISLCQGFSHTLEWKRFGADLLCGIVCILVLMLVSGLAHSGIGMGDIKLLASLGFACGAGFLWTIILAALLICAAVVIILLLMKKKTMKDSLPFAPYILFGYVAAMLTLLL